MERRRKKAPIEESGDPPSPLYAIALYDYERDHETGLSFQQGDIIQIITQLPSGWWDGVLNGMRGFFPSNYCEYINELDAVDLIKDYDSDSTDPESGLADIGDFIVAGELCWKVYKKCTQFSGDSDQFSSELSSLQAVIKETEESLLEQSLSRGQGARLQQLRQGCKEVLRDLEEIKSQRAFSRFAFEEELTQDLRRRITSYTLMLKAFINTYVTFIPVPAHVYHAETQQFRSYEIE